MTTTGAYGTLLVVDDATALARVAADRLCDWATKTSGPVRVALSGGSTPRRTYQELASTPPVDRFPWQRVHWFWGDERFVPPDDPASNFRMAREAAVAHGRPETRITLTYPAINASSHIAFLVSGVSKSDMLRQVMSARSNVPAARLHPLGDLVFIADRDAAGE